MSDLACVVTTINPPTASMRAWAAALPKGSPFLVVGDRKGPLSYDLPGAELMAFEAQAALPFRLAPLLPPARYARKNLGYLEAMQRGVSCIYETDDDNAPLPAWTLRRRVVSAQLMPPSDWCNVYRLFSDEIIWPRGFPLARLREVPERPDGGATLIERPAPVQQGLPDASPDVDAIWRLALDRPHTFQARPSVWLPPGTACPINSQSTWWWREAWPLMYLPSHCTFRMTDIWRGFVALRCLWAMGFGVVFHGAEVVQDRNPHDLMKDFADEIPGYLGNERFMAVLADLPLGASPGDAPANVAKCWRAIAAAGFVGQEEIPLVEAWAADVTDATSAR